MLRFAGDVGSGKTVVAVMAMLQAVVNGAQAALMAPTEILRASMRKRLAPGLMIGHSLAGDDGAQ